MKTILTTVLLIFFTVVYVQAQNFNDNNEPQTLFSPGTKVTGWFIDFSSSLSQLNDVYSYMPGFAGGIEMNNNFKIGIATKSLTYSENSLKFGNIMDEPVYLNGGYGGLFLETSPWAGKVLHVTFPCTIGGGGAIYLSENKYDETNGDLLDLKEREKATSAFFAIEPGINLEVNVTGFMKLYSGFSYRWTRGLNLENTPRNAFNAGSFNCGIKLGKF